MLKNLDGLLLIHLLNIYGAILKPDKLVISHLYIAALLRARKGSGNSMKGMLRGRGVFHRSAPPAMIETAVHAILKANHALAQIKPESFLYGFEEKCWKNQEQQLRVCLSFLRKIYMLRVVFDIKFNINGDTICMTKEKSLHPSHHFDIGLDIWLPCLKGGYVIKCWSF